MRLPSLAKHACFQGRHWSQGWAKTLREHPYTGAYIPQATLHREIHSKVHDVPVPNGKECREAVETLDRWLRDGVVSLDDSIEQRLAVLVGLFKGKCPATTAILEWQLEIVQKFYGHYNKDG